MTSIPELRKETCCVIIAYIFCANVFCEFIFSSRFPGLSTLANVVTSLATMDGNKQNGSGESEEDSQTNSQNGDLPQKETSNEVQ